MAGYVALLDSDNDVFDECFFECEETFIAAIHRVLDDWTEWRRHRDEDSRFDAIELIIKECRDDWSEMAEHTDIPESALGAAMRVIYA